ncbi:FtsX-like permease family protein [uncultured Phycicoccus sp.]|uniref:FtsX-like permease family protein n=1 Tax=uncultured Phycicoccus sp. TaxID=661422 RepID=UPI002629D147|nr:FtsX-like permease family protein [uncultured Phycicoccus sp.]
MSTEAPPRAEASVTHGRPASATSEPGRYAQWRASWAVALRMARRDVRRHRGRSALVVVMVLLPALLLSAVVTLAYTSDVTGPERIPSAMGTGQALLEGPEDFALAHLPEPHAGSFQFDREARPIPGYDRQQSAFGNADAVARLVGSSVAPYERFGVRTSVGDRRISLEGLALDGRIGLGDKLRLESGRWPAPPASDPSAPLEVLVTGAWTARDLPDTGSVAASLDGVERTLTIVGTARALETWSAPGIVTAGPVSQGVVGNGAWIVLGDDPVTWTDVQTLNEYGFRVTSADVLRNPPATAELPESLRDMSASDGQRTGLMVALAAVMLLVSTTLLVGPAFAVSATRQRRTLALAASNGAHTPVLRRTVLAQALVLGVTSAVLGVILGVLAAYGVVRWTADAAYPPFPGPFDVQVPTLLAVAACATASTLVAALIPARRLGRLDIVGVMRGQSVSPRPSVAVFVAGVVLAAVGAALTLGGTGVVDLRGIAPTVVSDNGETFVVVGAVVLIVGSLLLVPVVLTGVGRLGGHLPTSLRMAARDLARHRARSAPSVAAVLAVVAGLTFGLTGLESDTEQRRLEYLPATIPGEVLLSVWGDQEIDAGTVQDVAPGLIVMPNTTFVGDPTMTSIDPPTEPYRVRFVSIVPQGCTPEQTLGWLATDAADERCLVAGSQGLGSGTVLVLPADELVRRLQLTGADAQRVRDGAPVLTTAATGDTVRVVSGSYPVDPQAEDPSATTLDVDADTVVPAVRVPVTRENSGRMLGATLAFAAGSPTAAGWETEVSSWTIRDVGGAAVPDRVVEQVRQTFGDEVTVHREDGFQRDDRVVVGILLAVFALLILVVTLTSTALTLAEQQSDQATLAALGATRGTRRVMAAAQAFLLAIVGCVLGVAVGIVPGIAIARPLTSVGWDPLTMESVHGESILVIPWGPLLVVGLLVPVLAAGLAAAGIRRAPQVTRRST